MSIIIKDKDEQIEIISKGSEEKFKLYLDGDKEANNCLKCYASKGLRTLVFGSRVISAQEYKQWSEGYASIKDQEKS